MAVSIVSSPVSKPVSKPVTKAEEKQAPGKPFRFVSFDETRNVEYENKQWSAEEGKCSWYSVIDYQQIKSIAHAQAKQIWTREKRINSENSYKTVMLRVYDACCETEQESNSVLCTQDQALFAQAMSKSQSRTGLEKLSIREINHDKRYRRGHLVQTVLTLQTSSKASSRRARADLVRLSSEAISRASRLFARHMAVALATSLELNE